MTMIVTPLGLANKKLMLAVRTEEQRKSRVETVSQKGREELKEKREEMVEGEKRWQEGKI
jgi:hypothetical protein